MKILGHGRSQTNTQAQREKQIQMLKVFLRLQ